MNKYLLTSSQTVGPFFAPALLRKDAVRNVLVQPETLGERVRIEGHVLDGDRLPVPDALVEIWQANAHGGSVRTETTSWHGGRLLLSFSRENMGKRNLNLWIALIARSLRPKSERSKRNWATQPSSAQHADGPSMSEQVPLLTILRFLQMSCFLSCCGDCAIS